MRTFAGIEEAFAAFDSSEIILQSIPYDGTSTWGKGADKGFSYFLNASENMELYDIETDSEVFRRGVFLDESQFDFRTPETMYDSVLRSTRKLLNTNKFLTFFGGEHSISIGIIDAFREKYPNIGVLQIDAHADLRERYLGSEFNHACAMHRSAKTGPLVQVGIRSMDISEKEHLNTQNVFFDHDIKGSDKWIDDAIELLPDEVYLTIDLDGLDPSVMPSTGTPEPGGLDYYTLLKLFRKLFLRKQVLGFDIVEFAPIDFLKAPDFMVAKLYYKLLSYKFSK